MKKRRNFLMIAQDDELKRALNIVNIAFIREIKDDGTRIFMADGSSYDVEESYEEVFDIIIGKRKKHG